MEANRPETQKPRTRGGASRKRVSRCAPQSKRAAPSGAARLPKEASMAPSARRRRAPAPRAAACPRRLDQR